MELIDKDRVIAQINSVLNSYDPNEITSGRYALVDLRNFLDTLEVKEVDVEKEIKDYLRKQPIVARSRLVPSLEKIAKHFFELGMLTSNKTQKGE